MSLCFCRLLLGLLVVVFAWWNPSWGKIALTIFGVLMIILSLSGFCCRGKKGG
jgi:hypothetical protein